MERIQIDQLIAQWFPDASTPEIRDLLGASLTDLQAILCMYDGQYKLCYRDHNGWGHVRYLAPAAVRAAFVAESLDTGWIDPSIVRWGVGSRGTWVMQYRKRSRVNITIVPPTGDPFPLTVPLPPLLFMGRGRQYWVWACRNTFAPTMRLAYCPLPNVMGNGQICWGNNQPPLATAQTMQHAWDVFVNSPFTDHVVQGKSRRYPNVLDALSEQATHPAGKRYPLDDLVFIAGTPEQCVQQLNQ